MRHITIQCLNPDFCVISAICYTAICSLKITTLPTNANSLFNRIIPDIDECASSPCRGDVDCIDAVNGFMCDCNAGYTGIDCNIGEYSESEH